MPGLVVFGRRWAIGSDDFVLPGAFELSLRLLWWIGILVLYAVHKGQFNCPGGGLLHSYLLVLLVLLAAIICALSALVYVSMQGKEAVRRQYFLCRCLVRRARTVFFSSVCEDPVITIAENQTPF
uniref:Diacylglycerol lipase beta n=1 Tax=Anas platyrhynchos platyrhynchos TaxID=8840 RepID=A0A493TQU6_ANAPP